MSWVNNAIAFGLENMNGLVVLGGGCWLYVGLAGVSWPIANIVAGGLLMAIGAVPVWQQRKRKH